MSGEDGVKLARAKDGPAQAQLASKAKVTRHRIGLIEAGRLAPSLKLYTAIANALKTWDGLFSVEQTDEDGQR